MRRTDRDQAAFAAERHAEPPAGRAAGHAPKPPLYRDAPAGAAGGAGADAAKAPSPMMAQYLAIKAEHPDALLFYRMGDFYELFFEDAAVAARVLSIALTRRGRHEDADIPMCGVPVERHEDYLHRLIGAGHRVAICEQMEDPAEARKRGSKSVVRRAVVRLVTPGTLTEDSLLEGGSANWLTALARARDGDGRWSYGVAAVDISTGAFEVCDVAAAALGGEIGRLRPREIVLPEALAAVPEVAGVLDEVGVPVTRLGREPASPERRLADFFGLATLDGLGPLSPAETAAAATALLYLDRTQCGARVRLDPPATKRCSRTMEIDLATRLNLELTATLAGKREGSLLAAVDRCATAAGSRLLAARLASPLIDRDAIEARLAAIGFFVAEAATRETVRALLKRAPDLVRALGRLQLARVSPSRAGPRDLLAIAHGLAAAREMGALLADESFPHLPVPAALTAARDAAAAPDPALAQRLALTLTDAPPLQRRDGGFVRGGADGGLDEQRRLRDESREVIARLQATYCDLADSRRLKIKHNGMLGYFVEVPQALGELMMQAPLNATFVHRQTMVDAMRFSTTELGTLEARIAAAAEGALARENALFDALAEAVLDAGTAITAAADALAAIDVASALAAVAAERDWTRPHIEASGAFRIVEGRHPVVELSLRATGTPFVSNGCDLTANLAGGTVAVVTGPNMAGKSTFLRQNALIAVLAQMGSFVPAGAATIGIVDRLFSRVGAADDLARGRSTFMVEMVETAAILNRATPSSLVILDEIGRGTATFDGLSIAWAVMEHLHEKNRSRALFATHFHELTQLSRRLNRLVNLTTKVADWHGDVVFLHEVVPGSADRSYGIQVAKLAGLPPAVVRRARALLAELEAGERGAGGGWRLAELPLFAAAPSAEPAPASAIDPPAADALRASLDSLDPNVMSPREALEALYRLKAMADEATGR